MFEALSSSRCAMLNIQIRKKTKAVHAVSGRVDISGTSDKAESRLAMVS